MQSEPKRANFPTECCELEQEWREKGLGLVEQSLEATLLRYQDVSSQLLRQTALSQIEMMTRLMILEAKETQVRMNRQFAELYNSEMEHIKHLTARV
jgi:hypothetical protein